MPNRAKNNLPEMLRELSRLCEQVDTAALEQLVRAIHDAPAVFVAGAGRSGLVARAAAMRLMHLGKSVYVAGDTTTPAIRPGELLLAVSGSGETGSVALLAKIARERGASVALITAAPDSSLSRLADVSVRLPTPHPKAAADEFVPTFQPMSNFFEQGAFLVLEAVVIDLMKRTGEPESAMRARHANLE